MNFILKYIGSSVAKYLFSFGIGAAVLLFGLKIKAEYASLIETKQKYKQSLVEIGQLQGENESLEKLIMQTKVKYEQEIDRLDQDRKAIDDERKAIQKRAFIEAGKLKQKLMENQDAKDWYNSDMPDAIRGLRKQWDEDESGVQDTAERSQGSA